MDNILEYEALVVEKVSAAKAVCGYRIDQLRYASTNSCRRMM
jgi:hypothetical protein